jgi:hypothetical protein
MNNLLSYCGLVAAKIRASEKYLPVLKSFILQAARALARKIVHYALMPFDAKCGKIQ